MDHDYVSCWQLVTEVDKIVAGINADRLIPLLNCLGLTYLSHHRRLSSFGVINPIFFITASNQVSGEKTELVLRLSNPHPYWKTRKTLGVARAISFLAQYSSVAVPKLISWSCTEENPLGCAYDLSVKAKGIELEILLKDDQIPQETKTFWGRKVLEQVLLLKDQKLKQRLGQFDKMGMFTNLTEGYTLEDMTPGPLMIDGVPLGSFEGIKEWVEATIQWGLKMLSTPHGQPFRADFEPSLRYFLDHYLPSIHFNELDCQFSHCDLNPGNILIDPESQTISALIDWDGAGYLPPEFEWPSLLDCMEDCCGSKEAGLQLLNEYGINPPNGYQLTEKVISVAQHVNWMNFWCSTWWTSKPGERELITQQNAEYLPKCVAQREGLKFMELLKELDCWKPSTSNQEYLHTNPMPLDFLQQWVDLHGEF